MPTGQYERPPQWRAKWKNRLYSDVVELEAKRRDDQPVWGRQINVRMMPSMTALLHELSQARNITVTGYIRRAVARQMARDLGVDWRDVLRDSPYPAEYGKIRPPEDKTIRLRGRRGVDKHLRDDGTGYGDWEN